MNKNPAVGAEKNVLFNP